MAIHITIESRKAHTICLLDNHTRKGIIPASTTMLLQEINIQYQLILLSQPMSF